jgi:hypothetical protein
LLFAGAFVAVLLVYIAGIFISAIADNRQAADQADAQAPAITIDTKLQTDLEKAMSFDAIPAATEVQNPFVDRAGIGSNITVTGSQPAAATTNAAATGTRTNAAGGQSNMVRVSPTLSGTVTTVDNTKARWEDWAANANRGIPVGPESETLGIDDLVPVGYAGGGDRGVEVILYSLSLCRTFSFPAGTHFYNGVLSDINQNEVVFSNISGITRKSYSTSQPCTASGQSAGMGN